MKRKTSKDFENSLEYWRDLAKMRGERLELLENAFRKVLPILDEGYWDQHTAGTMPGSGYNHRVYRMISNAFGWQDSKVYTDWRKSLSVDQSPDAHAKE